MQRFLLAIAFTICVSPVWAQRGANDIQQEYLRAKALFQQRNWTSAMQAFGQVAAQGSNTTFAEYASFYYGVSGLYAGRPAESKAMFRQILAKYPTWDKIDEVHYWLARLYGGEQRWNDAFAEVDLISNKAIETDAWVILSANLNKGTGVTELKLLNQRRPDNKYIAEALARKISRQPLMNQDQDLLAFLIKRHNLDKNMLAQVDIAPTVYKKTYNVAVMLPFMANRLYPEKNIRDLYFPLDFYTGISLAQQELAEKGINLRITAYDTNKDSVATMRLLNTAELKATDLVIGPLFPGPAQAAGEWALKNQINVINPLSVNPDYVRNNPYVFLYKPSLITQAQKAAEFSARTFASRRATVIFGSKERDTLMARAYYERLRERGFGYIRMIKLDKGEEQDISDYLTSGTKEDYDEGGRLSADSLGHIFVASEDRLVVSSTVSALIGRSKRVPVVGLGSWINSSSKGESLVSYGQAERLGAFLLAPEYIDYSSPNFFTFREKYIAQVHAMPSEYAYQGYDLMMYFGGLLSKHGTIFQNALDKEPFTKGSLCTGFDYAGKQDNQCVPVVIFKNSALEVVYQ